MPTSKKKIFVIDDDEAILAFLERKIGYLYELTIITEPARALVLALSEKPDLILCDIDMPAMDGGDISAQFYKDPRVRGIPFAFLTSFVSPQEVRDLRNNVGGRPGISKATPAPEMIEAIERLLNAPGLL